MALFLGENTALTEGKFTCKRERLGSLRGPFRRHLRCYIHEENFDFFGALNAGRQNART